MKRFFAYFMLFFCLSGSVLGATISGGIYDFSLNLVGNVVVEIDTAPKQFFVSKNGSYSFSAPLGTYEVKAQQYDRGRLISSITENITIRNNGDYNLDLILFPEIREEEALNKADNEIDDAKSFSIAWIVIITLIVFFSLFVVFYKVFKLENKLKISNLNPFSKNNDSLDFGDTEYKYEVKTSDYFDSVSNFSFGEDKGSLKEIKKEGIIIIPPDVKEKEPEYDSNKDFVKSAELDSIKESDFQKEKADDLYGDEILSKILDIINAEGGRTTQKDIRKKIPFSEAKISLAITELEAKGKIKKIKKGRGNVIILS